MGDATSCISALDDALAAVGEDIVLRRTVGLGDSPINIDVTCRAIVRTYRLREDELVGGVTESVVLVTISPTQIKNAQWPGGTAAGQSIDPSIPQRTDQLQIRGRWRSITAIEPIPIDGVIVRYDFQVIG